MSDHNKQPIPKGYKWTEVGVIPEDWVNKCVGDILKIRHGKDQKNIEDSSGMYPIFATGGEIGRTNIPIYNKPSILIGRKGTINKPRFTEEPFWTVDTLFYSEVFEDIYPKFIYYKFCLINWMLYNEASGVPSLNSKVIESIPLIIPSEKKEQVVIADVLSDADNLIQSLKQLIAKKQAIKTATMQQLLTGKTRLPEFAFYPDGKFKGTKQSELGEIPEDWEAISINKIANIFRGASPRPIDDPKWFNENSTIGWLRISDVSNTDKYLTRTVQHLSNNGIRQSRFVPQNNLVMSICATVGKPVILKKDVCIHDGFVVFDALNKEKELVYYILKKMESEWHKHGQVGSQMNLNTKLIKSTVIAVPKISQEQTAIATILSDMDKEIKALEARLKKAELIKEGMMQELLTGKTRLI